MKVFFVFVLCFVKHKSVKIFDEHIMQFIIINYTQQTHKVFKFFIWNVNWKSQPIFITKHINANVVFCFNLGLCLFMIRDPMIHDPKKHDLGINYANMLYMEIHRDIKEVKIKAWYANTWFPDWRKQIWLKKLQLLTIVVFLCKIFWWK